MEERRKRLKAHRDMLLKQKNDQRKQELEEYHGKAGNKDDLHKELKDIDAKAKAKEHLGKYDESLDLQNLESSEYDKRLAMYMKLREELQSEISKGSQAEQEAKMNELNKKIQDLEKAKQEKEKRD